MDLDPQKEEKAAGTDGICPTLEKTCSKQLCEILKHLFSLRVCLQRIPTLWKASCLLPAPKKSHPTDSSDYRPGDLTAHILKTPVGLVLACIRPTVRAHVHPPQVAYQPNLSKTDAHIYMLQRGHLSLDTTDALWIVLWRIMLFDFPSALNTIQPGIPGKRE